MKEVICMRVWKAILKWLADQPQGFSADGRMVGLSLTAAMDKERQQVVTEAEGYLRGRAAESRGNATSL
jgi:hypothetical protein